MKKDARRHHRVPLIGPVRLSWEDRGEVHYANAKCVDVSEAGMRIECPVGIAAGASVVLNAERIRFSGAAKVKHVTRYAGKYIVGVELAQLANAKTLAALREPWAMGGSVSVV